MRCKLDNLAVLETDRDTAAILSAMSLLTHWVLRSEEGDLFPIFVALLNEGQCRQAALN